jgi:oxygen-independent coproporphyrinogen-3 oxidase
MSSTIEKARAKAEQVDLEALKEIGIERTLEGYYLLGNYPPLTALSHSERKDVFKGNTQREFDTYLHIPFCDQLCNFCHFPFDLSGAVRGPCISSVESYLSDMKKEISMLNERIGGIIARSVYMGGGTPSFLSTGQLEDLLKHLRSEIEIGDVRFSFDMHPNSIHQRGFDEKLDMLREYGVNRVPIGGVDLTDKVLQGQQRGHTAKDTVNLAHMLKQKGFSYVVTDLIMGVPGQTPENWLKTLDILIENCEIDCAITKHLMFKKSAKIYKHYKRNPEDFPDIKDRMLQQLIAIERFAEAGYEQEPLYYFNRNSEAVNDQQVRKFESIDETGLLGIGVSSFGFVNGYQYFNSPDRTKYQFALYDSLPVWMASKLTPRQLFERDVMFGLKMSRGVDKQRIREKHGLDVNEEYAGIIQRFTEAGLLEDDGQYLRQTETGILFAEEVCDHFAGEDVRRKAEKEADSLNPIDPMQRFNYNMIGHRLE